LAHILQRDSKAKEIYLADAEIKDSKYLLIVYENGELELKWCYEDIVEVQVNPILVKSGKRMLLEFGDVNLFNLRERKPFQNEEGNLDEMWEKII